MGGDWLTGALSLYLDCRPASARVCPVIQSAGLCGAVAKPASFQALTPSVIKSWRRGDAVGPVKGPEPLALDSTGFSADRLALRFSAPLQGLGGMNAKMGANAALCGLSLRT